MRTSHGIYDLRCPRNAPGLRSGASCFREEFRRALCAFIGTEKVILTDTGRTALFLALGQLGCSGKEVLVNAYTTDVVHRTIEAAGAVPVPYDIDPVSLRADISSVAGRISERTGAIVHTGLFGFSCAPADMARHAQEWQIPLIEDACNSLGCIEGDVHVGLFGEYALFSFRVGKPLSTGGGALVANSAGQGEQSGISQTLRGVKRGGDIRTMARIILDYLAMNPLVLRYVARPLRQATKNTPLGDKLVQGGVVDTASIPSMGTLQEMGEMQSRLALASLYEYSERMLGRRKRGRRLRAMLSATPMIPVGVDSGLNWNGLFCPALMPCGSAEELRSFCRRRGFDLSRFHAEVPGQIVPQNSWGAFPGTEELVKRLVCIPNPRSKSVRERLVGVIRDFFRLRGAANNEVKRSSTN
jgi:dTDP-4-amino-4,6-dideoxygalactose transaminase